jgi:hypothetical protein
MSSRFSLICGISVNETWRCIDSGDKVNLALRLG